MPKPATLLSLSLLFLLGVTIPSYAVTITVTAMVDANQNSISVSNAAGNPDGLCQLGSPGCSSLVDTGLLINLGDQLDIMAAGLWTISGSDPFVDANGQAGRFCNSGVTWPCSSLLGQITNTPIPWGTPGVENITFFVGTSFSTVSSLEGRLFLGFNDTDFGNNSGSVTATVTYTPLSQPPPGSVPVPEPTTLVLVGSGVAGLVLRRYYQGRMRKTAIHQ